MNESGYIKSEITKTGLTCTDVQADMLNRYYEMIIERNKVVNLTAITSFTDAVEKHFVDSLLICKVCDISGTKIIDIGTGAGFPGIPLKIIYPDTDITLLDSLNKRLLFIDEVIKELNLKNVRTIHGRAEDIAHMQEHREKYDLCVSRAVANLSTLSELCIPFVKENGKFISYKSSKIEQEIHEAQKAIKIMGGSQAEYKEVSIPDSDILRSFIIIQKKRATPKSYPRKAGTPAKSPVK